MLLQGATFFYAVAVDASIGTHHVVTYTATTAATVLAISIRA